MMLKREIILKNTAELVMKKGMGNIRVQDVADKLGVTRPNLYYHFKNKKELIASLYAWVESEYHNHIRQNTEILEDPIEAIMFQFDMLLGAMAHAKPKTEYAMSALAFELAMNGKGNEKLSLKYYESNIARIRLRLQEGRQRDYFRSDMNPEKVAGWIVSNAQGAMLMHKSGCTPNILEDTKDLLRDYLECQKSTTKRASKPPLSSDA